MKHDEFAVSQLHERLKKEREMLKTTLALEIRNLRVRLAQVEKSIEDGTTVDVLFIANLGGMTELLTRWESIRNYMPYLEMANDESA